MRDSVAVPLIGRLHAMISRFSREGGNIEAQGDIGEAAARIVQLERVMGALIDHIDHVSYFDATGSRLSDATPAVATARAVLKA